MNKYFVLAKTFQAMALAYQSYATLVTIGFNPSDPIPFGPQH